MAPTESMTTITTGTGVEESNTDALAPQPVATQEDSLHGPRAGERGEARAGEGGQGRGEGLQAAGAGYLAGDRGRENARYSAGTERRYRRKKKKPKTKHDKDEPKERLQEKPKPVETTPPPPAPTVNPALGSYARACRHQTPPPSSDGANRHLEPTVAAALPSNPRAPVNRGSRRMLRHR